MDHFFLVYFSGLEFLLFPNYWYKLGGNPYKIFSPPGEEQNSFIVIKGPFISKPWGGEI